MAKRPPREWVPSAKRNFVPLTDDEKRQRLAQQIQVSPQAKSEPFKTRYTMNHDEHIEASGRYGPFSRVVDIKWPAPNGTQRKYWRNTAVWWRSKTKRRKTPNPYTMYTADYVAQVGNIPSIVDVPNAAPTTWVVNGGNSDALASNKARTQFVGQVRDNNTASLAVTLAEWGQAQSMIVLRASQLLKGIRAAKRGDLNTLGKVLQPPKGFRPKAKAGANLWLEYHFGWVPLIQDVYDACKVLSSNPPAHKVRGRGRASETVSIGNFVQYQHTVRGTYDARVLICADVYVSNPNLALANQLGLINPATVAWEIVPFSFLVDWFIPVGKLLDSFTDLLGYKIEYPFTTTTRRAEATDYYPQASGLTADKTKAAAVIRVLGIPAFRMATPPFKGFSCARGATAISLVIQQFLSIGKK